MLGSAQSVDRDRDLRTIRKDRGSVEIMELERVVQNIDRRLSKVEQILPTLATKEDLRALRSEMRTHFSAVAGRLESYVRVVAEGHTTLQKRRDEANRRYDKAIAQLDRRVSRLDAR
jgi:hypothetical protein